MTFQIILIAEASVESLMMKISDVIINPLIYFIFTLAVVYFLYGLIKYLLNPESEEVVKSSKSHMLWGIIGMFIMVGVFGIMKIIITTLGEESNIQVDGGKININENISNN